MKKKHFLAEQYERISGKKLTEAESSNNLINSIFDYDPELDEYSYSTHSSNDTYYEDAVQEIPNSLLPLFTPEEISEMNQKIQDLFGYEGDYDDDVELEAMYEWDSYFIEKLKNAIERTSGMKIIEFEDDIDGRYGSSWLSLYFKLG